MSTHARTLISGIALVAAAGLALTGCTAGPSPEGETKGGETVTLIVHNSFPNDEFAAAASAATGYNVEVVAAGDGGELASQLVLTQNAPLADAFFGVDNVYVSRLFDADVIEGGEAGAKAVTQSATCINIDPAWFAAKGIAEPSSYEDLADEKYRGLTVLLDPSTSSTGASFLIGTVAKFGESGFADYWSKLAANDARIEQGWTEAYNGQFTQGGGDGTFPIVLSYSSSPAWTLSEDGTSSSTKALLDTCSSQIEYAGVLQNASNQAGAQAVVDYLLSTEFQNTIADTMYVYPTNTEAAVPEEWSEFAPMPSAPNDLSPAEIGKGRDTWLKNWSAATGW
ncbi:thiamine ABC transporter substrate-binding protein [Leucobacter sp. UT-8R-CII-1-4]|uniref:thiamine ABC transporter substrate-binding protein n=1 Tax=Leucobacter sp. UT-8R-CII-1-4 TaxID=3040075 RepID=UPI0024A8D333|nr:thiamine ABC transporter substrate-binding protein [Leucobacter sp. UT-8R-CII-1-4]MDI6023236.1 thiamine ABC transporter substrate-binding protein [Leucobacter sp. UT-8R-CII-1-4]